MVCELQIKLGSGRTASLYHSNHFIYEIERVCGSRDRYKLFEVYAKGLHYSSKHKATFDSHLVEDTEINEYKYIEEMKNRQILTQILPFCGKLLKSKS